MKAMLISLLLAGMTQVQGTTYPLAGIVIDVRNDVVTFEVASGNRFAFCGSDDYEEGDLVAVVMDDMGTECVYDDEVIDARYAGHLEGMEGGWN